MGVDVKVGERKSGKSLFTNLMNSPIGKTAKEYMSYGQAGSFADKGGNTFGVEGQDASKKEGGANFVGPAQPTPQEQINAEPAPQAESTAMSRRLQTYQGDARQTLQAGLDALKDPAIPDDLREQYARPLLQAKHYGTWG